jgi:uncharacterized repeat protein (TIGR03803 family)
MDGVEKVLHSFGLAADGADPVGSLIKVKGTLYGTTSGGGLHKCGTFRCGTVFSIATGGTEKVLYSFSGPPDGEDPAAGLIDVGGTLYGTTAGGGALGGGTIFSISLPSGTERVLYSFRGPDGVFPEAGLIEVGGMLYGTTAKGGAYPCGVSGVQCGTVFSVTTSGAEKVLHSFGNGTDGAGPAASLIDVNGTLYGTTELGGGAYNDGTVFAITP